MTTVQNCTSDLLLNNVTLQHPGLLLGKLNQKQNSLSNFHVVWNWKQGLKSQSPSLLHMLRPCVSEDNIKFLGVIDLAC